MSDEDSFQSKLNEYYKLKSEYDASISNIKKKIINNKSLSRKEKREEFKNYKPKCVNCKRVGGTNFNHISEDDNRFVTAICNVSSNPCNLDIKINLGSFYLISDLLDELQEDINKLKNKIIENKNKQLFNIITDEETISIFNDLKKDLNENLTLLEEYTMFYIEKTENASEKEDYKKEFENLQIYIAQIKESIQKFNETENGDFINDAINIYLNKLSRVNNILLNIKYKTNFVWFDGNDETYHLIQQKYSIESNQLDVVTPKIESFIYGSVKYNKNIPLDENKLTGPTFYIKNGIITWKNSSYEKIFNRLSKKIQEQLKKDEEWMQLFLNSCYEKRKKGEACEFINAPNLIIPPEKISVSGLEQFNFGNEEYNIYFNKLNSSYQNTLLTLYSVKKGKKDYTMLLDTLARLIGDHLDYNRDSKYAPI